MVSEMTLRAEAFDGEGKLIAVWTIELKVALGFHSSRSTDPAIDGMD
jgi:hypothetical protein